MTRRGKVAAVVKLWVLLLLLLAAGEVFTQCADRVLFFRLAVLRSFKYHEESDRPPDDPFRIPPPKLAIRAPEGNLDGRFAVLGGMAIPDSTINNRRAVITPEDVDWEEKKVFVIGASAAWGIPYPYADSFAAKLDRAIKPEGFRVLNAAYLASPTGGGVKDITRRVVDFYNPHTLIIYTGYNEFIDWYAPLRDIPKTQTPEQKRRLYRIVETLTHSRLVAWVLYRYIEYLREHQDSIRAKRPGYQINREMVGIEYALAYPLHAVSDYDISQWPETKARYLRNFESNVIEMVNYAQSRGVRCILLTAPFNYRLSPAWYAPQPLAYEPGNLEVIQQALERITAAHRQADMRTVLSLADEALALEPQVPVLHYLKGMALEALERHEEAHDAYARCQEEMIGNLGSVLSQNQAVRNAALATGATLLDLPRLFDSDGHRRGVWYNTDLIRDDCHPTPRGHDLITEALLPFFTEAARP